MSVKVICGTHEQCFDLHGNPIGMVRRSLRDVFNISPYAGVFVGGVVATDGQILIDDDVLEFVHEHGTKGLGGLLTSEELRERWQIGSDEYEELLVLGLPLVRFGSGAVRHPEVAVDEFMRLLGDPNRPKPSELVGTPYVAEQLGCTTVWITELIRNGDIPPSCLVPGTGNGKPWKFVRVRIDEWLKRR